jgi:hypothetical protein
LGLGVLAPASRDAAAGPRPTFSIRKGSVRFFLTLATSAGSHRWNIVKLFYGECHSPSRDFDTSLRLRHSHAGVCEFRIARQEKIGGQSPLLLMPIDSVDSCVTNHRIVRELRTDHSVLPGAFLTRG